MDKQTERARKSTDHMVDYDHHSSAQQSIISAHDADIRRIARMVASNRQDLRLVDYGCGPGRSALTSVRPAIEVFHEEIADLSVSVCHSDQPGNDWNALFELVFGEQGYHASFPDTRTEAAIGSFYERVADKDSVDLATCFAASHWLSQAIQLHAPETLWFADLQGDARKELEAFARSDWTRFLRRRAEEIRTGGFLFVSTLGSVPDPSELNGSAGSGRGIYRALHVVAKSMVEDGLLESDVYDKFLFSLWFMTADEARAPIEQDEILAQAFEIELVEVVPSPKNPTDFFGEYVSDPESYATKYTGYTRAFAETTLRTQLFEPCSHGTRSADVLDEEFWRRFHEVYKTDLSKYAFELWHLTVILRKK